MPTRSLRCGGVPVQAQEGAIRRRAPVAASLREQIAARLSCESIDEVRSRMGEKIDHKVRDFLRVHNRGGQPCPRCGRALTELRANQRITTYCRGCQPPRCTVLDTAKNYGQATYGQIAMVVCTPRMVATAGVRLRLGRTLAAGHQLSRARSALEARGMVSATAATATGGGAWSSTIRDGSTSESSDGWSTEC